MPDIFISHSKADIRLADFLLRHMTQDGLSVYLATVSMQPGERWLPVMMDNLQTSTWVLCLASRVACTSPWVMQEMGAAIGTNKRINPIVWDQRPDDLPGWMRQYQAINLFGVNQQVAMAAIERFAVTIKAEKQRSLFIFGLLLAGIALLAK